MTDDNHRIGPTRLNRRKIRKGTQSCWECKRRKIRCSFRGPTETTCDGCRSRRTRCVGQEVHDQGPVSNGKHSTLEFEDDQLAGRRSAGSDESSEPAGILLHGLRVGCKAKVPPSTVSIECHMATELDDISHALRAAWPSQQNLDLILSVPIGTSVLFHGVVCQPYSQVFSRQPFSPRQMLELPPPGSHPVLVARKLLLLGTLLQGISTFSATGLTELSQDYRAIMARVFHAATRLVTSNDELIDSVEGIECVMIESMYLNNAGNLRRAWLANRRAMVMAQSIGLHLGAGTPRMLSEEETQARVEPSYMWARLIFSDRYLSLMLGLPQGSPGEVCAGSEMLDSCSPLERLERLHAVAGGLIIEQTRAGRINVAAMSKIDTMLRKAVDLMPPKWWLMPSMKNADANDGTITFEETIRLMCHFTHHHLLVQLHLPYMMLPSSAESNYNYSKLTAANASRSIISLYITFRDSTSSPAYCRGVDFIAFVACVTLCIAHMPVRDQLQGVTSLHALRHQRLADRGLLESTLEIVDHMGRDTQDVVARKISSILQPLLALEGRSSEGSTYSICVSTEESTQDSHCLGNINQSSNALHIQIPYIGTIMIDHLPHTGQLHDDAVPLELATDPAKHLDSSPFSKPPLTRDRFPTGYAMGDTHPVNTDWEAAPSYPCQREPSGISLSFGANETQEMFLLVPGLTAEVDDWALQGVDMALFDSLTRASRE